MVTSAAFWDKAAPRYAQSKIRDMPAYEHTLARVAAHLKPTDHVLELGCGTGTTALRLADQVHHLTSTDIAEEMIRIAQDKARDQMVLNVTFQRAGVAELVQTGQRYDAVFAFNLFHLINELEQTLDAIAGIVKPGGLLISKTPCMNSGIYNLLRPVVGAMRLVGKAPYVRFLRPQEVADMVRAAGFELLERGDFPKSPPSHFIVARKL